jgi:hypothetical protein
MVPRGENLVARCPEFRVKGQAAKVNIELYGVKDTNRV